MMGFTKVDPAPVMSTAEAHGAPRAAAIAATLIENTRKAWVVVIRYLFTKVGNVSFNPASANPPNGQRLVAWP